MARRLRFVPEGGALVEVTCRAQQGRLLLLPSPELNDIVLGVLGHAQRLYPVRLCAYVFLANHFHLLLDVDDQQLSLFMGYFNSNLAREIARRTGWEDKDWGRRYQALPVSDEEAAQVARLECLPPGRIAWYLGGRHLGAQHLKRGSSEEVYNLDAETWQPEVK
jgi:hypothetical protein